MVTSHSSLNWIRQGEIWKQKPYQLFEPTEFNINNCLLWIVLLIEKGSNCRKLIPAPGWEKSEDVSLGAATETFQEMLLLHWAAGSEFEMKTPVVLGPRSWRRWPADSDVSGGPRVCKYGENWKLDLAAAMERHCCCQCERYCRADSWELQADRKLPFFHQETERKEQDLVLL